MRPQSLTGQPPCLGVLLGSETVLRDEQLALVQREILPQEAQVTRQVGHGAEERVQLGAGQCGIEPLVQSGLVVPVVPRVRTTHSPKPTRA